MATPHVKLLDLANPKQVKDTLNALIDLYDAVDVDVRDIADEALAKAEQAVLASGDYTPLINKPKINGIELSGDKTSEEIGIKVLTNKELENLLK